MRQDIMPGDMKIHAFPVMPLLRDISQENTNNL